MVSSNEQTAQRYETKHDLANDVKHASKKESSPQLAKMTLIPEGAFVLACSDEVLHDKLCKTDALMIEVSCGTNFVPLALPMAPMVLGRIDFNSVFQYDRCAYQADKK